MASRVTPCRGLRGCSEVDDGSRMKNSAHEFRRCLHLAKHVAKVQRGRQLTLRPLLNLVGDAGFEPATPAV